MGSQLELSFNIKDDFLCGDFSHNNVSCFHEKERMEDLFFLFGQKKYFYREMSVE